MNELHVTELNIMSVLFATALFVFLMLLNRREQQIRKTYVRMLLAGGFVAFSEALLGIMLNAGVRGDVPAPVSMFCFILLDIAETTECIAFIRYVADHAADPESAKKKTLQPVRILFVFYLLLQAFNFFTGIAFTTSPAGRLIGGPLMVPVVYGIPGILLLYGVILYFSIVRKETIIRRFTVLSAAIFPLAAAFLQIACVPHVMMIGFAVVLSDFLIYFVFETPPFRQLSEQLRQLEETTKRAQEAKEKALSEDAAMNDFLANMSHEIRTPLTAILGYDEVILNDAAEEDVKEAARDIRGASNTLLYIVNDILDFSKIESGDLSLSISAYHLSDVIDNIGNIIRKRARDKGLEYRTMIDRTMPDELIGDGIRVNQIMINLLNNAVKYTEHGYAQLAVNADIAQDKKSLMLHIRVEDSGIGIRKEELPKLFDAFARFDSIRNRGVEGTGLGLAITSRLVDLMGGTISATSVYGEGSVFSVDIPQQIASAESMNVRDAREEKEAVSGAGVAFYAPDARLLVVDDNETNRTVVAELLRPTKIRVDSADGGAEALSLVQNHAYDIILMDQMMPRMSGPQTLAAMRTLPENASKNAAVIAFTANAIAGAREQLLSLGFDDYLSKPVTGADLCGMIIKHAAKEKIMLPGSPGYEENLALSRSAKKDKTEEQRILEELKGIDLSLALTYCGTREVLFAAVRDFYITISQQADVIERYCEEEDYQNYTIKVHALKSAARSIGAEQLSEDAAYLERCGNEKRHDEIREKTPALLSLYRSYTEKLAAVSPDAKKNDDREEIGMEDLREAYEEIKQFAIAFDFDGIDSVMESLEAYRIPVEEQPHFEAVRLAVANVSREMLLALL